MGADRLPDPLGDPLGAREPAVLQQQAELVAAQAPQRIAGAHPLVHHLAELPQQLVACQVAAGVVDLLEAVQIQEAHGMLGAAVGGARHRADEPLLEFGAVDESGERIVGRLVGELPRDQARVGHVAGHDGRAGDRPGGVPDGSGREIHHP